MPALASLWYSTMTWVPRTPLTAKPTWTGPPSSLPRLGIQLEIRATDYNQFQDKVRRGKHQIFTWGWLADYPDAENFLFLLYGPGAKSVHDGENAANYQNADYDRLYSTLRSWTTARPNRPVIDQMVRILQEDAPWSWGYSTHRGRITAGCATANPASWCGTRRSTTASTPPKAQPQPAGLESPGLLAGSGRVGGVGRHGLGSRQDFAGTRSADGLAAPRSFVTERSVMLQYILRRLGYGLVILIGVNLITFLLFFTVNTPDDMARLNIGGKRVMPDQIEKWKVERGYDKPMLFNDQAQGTDQLTQTVFWERSVSLFVFDFGRADNASGGDIGYQIAQRMGVSLRRRRCRSSCSAYWPASSLPCGW